MPRLDEVLPEVDTVVRDKGGRFMDDFRHKSLRYGDELYHGSDEQNPVWPEPPAEGGPLNPAGQNRSIVHRAPALGDADFGMEIL